VSSGAGRRRARSSKGRGGGLSRRIISGGSRSATVRLRRKHLCPTKLPAGALQKLGKARYGGRRDQADADAGTEPSAWLDP